jgi:D-psicose/D-tagatose/L-ribulose 3-epimerase
MKLVVSNIAWANEEETAVAKLLQKLDVKYVEIAPTKKWQDPTQASGDEVNAYQDFWRGYGIEIVAFQSMLFSRPDLKIFESDAMRQQTAELLKDYIRLAGKMGAKVLVFGSPKNRQRGELPYEQAFGIAREFFNDLGDVAQENNTSFCIEPNPTDYSCDFVTNARQGIELVNSVNNPGFGLHLDIAGMSLAGDDIQESIKQASSVLRHFHASSPFLGQVEEEVGIDHATAAKTLADINYKGYVSIEMRPGEVGQNVERVKKAVNYALDAYKPLLS